MFHSKYPFWPQFVNSTPSTTLSHPKLHVRGFFFFADPNCTFLIRKCSVVDLADNSCPWLTNDAWTWTWHCLSFVLYLNARESLVVGFLLGENKYFKGLLPDKVSQGNCCVDSNKRTTRFHMTPHFPCIVSWCGMQRAVFWQVWIQWGMFKGFQEYTIKISWCLQLSAVLGRLAIVHFLSIWHLIGQGSFRQ